MYVSHLNLQAYCAIQHQALTEEKNHAKQKYDPVVEGTRLSARIISRKESWTV